jgi:hypothetical protein
MPKPLRYLLASLIVALSCAAQAGNLSPAFARHTPISFYQTVDDGKFARWLFSANQQG